MKNLQALVGGFIVSFVVNTSFLAAMDAIPKDSCDAPMNTREGLESQANARLSEMFTSADVDCANACCDAAVNAFAATADKLGCVANDDNACCASANGCADCADNVIDEVAADGAGAGTVLRRVPRFSAVQEEIKDVLIEFSVLMGLRLSTGELNLCNGSCPEIDAVLKKSVLAINHLKQVSSKIKFKKLSTLLHMLKEALRDVEWECYWLQDLASQTLSAIKKQERMLDALECFEAQMRGRN